MFLTELDIRLEGDAYWVLDGPLVYCSEMTGLIVVPVGFETDLASVPRLPIIYEMWGNRSHREAVLHDYLYCYDCFPDWVTFATANRIFLEAMKSRRVAWYIRYPMFWGVCLMGRCFYHQRSCLAKLGG